MSWPSSEWSQPQNSVAPGTEFSFGRPPSGPRGVTQHSLFDSTDSQLYPRHKPPFNSHSGGVSDPAWGDYSAHVATADVGRHPVHNSANQYDPNYGALTHFGISQPLEVSSPPPYPIPSANRLQEPEIYAFPSRTSSRAPIETTPQASDEPLSGDRPQLTRPHQSHDNTVTASSAYDRSASDGPLGDDSEPFAEPLSFLDSVNLSSLAENGSTLFRRALPVLGGLYLAQKALESASEATRFAANTALHPLHLPLAVSEQVASAATSVVSGGVGLAARGSANVLLGTAKTLPSALWTITKFGTRFTKHFVNSLASAAVS